MPFLKEPKVSITLQKELKCKRDGFRHAIFKVGQGFYKGIWKNDVKSELGYFVSKKSMYEGTWRDDKRNGYGIFSRKKEDGSYSQLYEGEWLNGKPHGEGVRYYPDGSVFHGRWSNGMRQGWGRMWFSDGSFYYGEWTNDAKEGMGVFVYPNGNRYEGQWSTGMKNGEGIFYHLATGQIQEGTWSNDVCVSSNMKDVSFRQVVCTPTPYPIPTFFTVPAVTISEEGNGE